VGQVVSPDGIYRWDRLLGRMVYIGGTYCYPGLYIFVGQVVSQDDIGGTGC